MVKFKVETIVNGPFAENCYLAYDEDSKKGILIDPGSEPEHILRTVQKLKVELTGIYNTHGHIDHAGAVHSIQESHGIPFAIHPQEGPVLDSLPAQAAMFGVSDVHIPSVDLELTEDSLVQVGPHEGRVLFTPGHTPGGICFLFDDVLFSGDTLFAGSIGRTDLPGGSSRTLLDSIQNKLLTLDDSVRVFSGHGPETSVGQERSRNPFLQASFLLA